MPKISLQYLEEGSNRKLVLSEGEVQPLGFDELAGLKLHEPISFPLRLSGVRVASSDFDDLDADGVRSVAAELNSTYGSTVVGLLQGGWLPSGLALADALLLPDRCTVAAIRSRFLAGKVKTGKGDDFLDFAAGYPLKINPMLYAMEGASGTASPEEEELSALFDRASSKILEALPLTEIFPPKAAVMQGALGLIRDTAESLARKQRFLVKAVPLIAGSTGRVARAGIWRDLCELAERHHVAKASMLMLTLLSATSARQGLNPAKGLLKPSLHFTDKNAFNALMDLRSLDLLIAAGTDFPEQRVVLLTEDRDLALLWTGLQTHSHRREGSNIHYAINAHRSLFAGLTDAELGDMWAMLRQQA